MSIIMNMPKIGVNMTDAVIVGWIAKEGDIVMEGDHLLDAETDKAVQEIYATVSGRLTKILAPAGAEVLCQEPIAEFAAVGDQSEDGVAVGGEVSKEKAPILPPAAAHEAPAIVQGAPAVQAEFAGGRIRISPLAKKIANDLGIAVSELKPSEPGARIVKADVLKHKEALFAGFMEYKRTAESAAPATIAAQDATAEPTMSAKSHLMTFDPFQEAQDPKTEPTISAPAATLPYSGIRRRIGERMTESWQTKPAVALTLHASADRLVEWRKSLKREGRTTSYNDLFVLIAARALREHPAINSRLEENAIKLLREIHIGVAVDTERGLMVPVIRHADRKNLMEIGAEIRAKVEAVRTGNVAPEDLSGGTFTITNLGMYEIEQFSPVINPPESCILALGAIVREPVVDEHDRIVIRSRMQMTLVFDHRIVDGAPAARFLQRVKRLVECPMELIG